MSNLFWLAQVTRLPGDAQIEKLTSDEITQRADICSWQKAQNGGAINVQLAAAGVAVALMAWSRVPSSQAALRLIDRIIQHDQIGDPRGVANNEIWAEVSQIANDAYVKLLGALNRGDIEFFFNNMSGLNDDRRDFWLGYADRMVRTQVVLRTIEHERLLVRFREGSEQRAIVDRAFRFQRPSPQNILIFFFDQCVAVEAGETGQACFVYDKNVYTKSIDSGAKSFRDNIVSGSSASFNDRLKSTIRQSHQPGWQRKLAEKLELAFGRVSGRRSS